MATKHLARTLVEGGREPSNIVERRTSHRALRAATRALRARLADPEAWWHAPEPAARVVAPGQTDKLGPLRRWLDRRCGRPWDEVRAELARRFDTRSLAGRHLVRDHVLREVATTGRPGRPWEVFRYAVDERGRLRALARPRPPARPRRELDPAEARAVRELAGERKIGRRGGVLFWFEPTVVRVATTDGPAVGEPTGRYRQRAPLDGAEAARLAALTAPARERVLLR